MQILFLNFMLALEKSPVELIKTHEVGMTDVLNVPPNCFIPLT